MSLPVHSHIPTSIAGSNLQRLSDLLGDMLFVLTSVVGLLAFLYPFILPQAVAGNEGLAHQQDAPLIFVMIATLCLGMIFLELEHGGLTARLTALLGILVAINASLRALDLALPIFNIGGFSPIFFLFIICGYAFGARFGFLLGALTMALSALITGGIGPWLPYQMLAAGWVGMSSGWFRPKSQVGRRGDNHSRAKLEIWLLVGLGLFWGIAFGAIMNLFFWPFTGGGLPAEYSQQAPGEGILEGMRRYTAFYVVTSLWWDLGRSVGNAILLLALGQPVLRLLRRFQHRFTLEVVTPGNKDIL
ncbi:MAG: ECF transporter S component [Chloroflexi bacterium]|nr:ECF transporter S component [Chloroflexota bacterium]